MSEMTRKMSVHVSMTDSLRGWASRDQCCDSAEMRFGRTGAAGREVWFP